MSLLGIRVAQFTGLLLLGLQGSTFAESKSSMLTVPGLQRQVVMKIDAFGITHIKAENDHDLFFAQGYNAARDRLWQMDFWRRSGLGKLAEVFGEDYIDRDRAARLFLYRGSLEGEWSSYGPNAKLWSSAFVAGINAYVNALRRSPVALPVEFADLEYLPQTWSVDDLVRIRQHGVWQNLTAEVERSFMHCYGSKNADLIRQKLEPEHEVEVPVGVDVCALPDDVLKDYLAAAYPPNIENGWGGSNNWAIAGSRTASGRPILAGDPHRALTVPSLRYAVHLTSPSLNVIGAGEPQMPGIATGHNGQVAFGFTIFPADQQDLLVYELNPRNPLQYRYQGKWEFMSTERIVVAVRNEKSVERELRFTRHGPVIYQDDKTAYAVRSVSSEQGSAPYFGQMSLLTARSTNEYDAALTAWGAPGEHHVFADADGNIAWRSAAKVPIRDNYDGLLPVSGNGDHEWRGFHALDELPGGKNPASGWIATANNQPRLKTYPYAEKKLTFEWVSDARVRRIGEVLDASTEHSIASSVALQNDYTSVFAREMVSLVASMDFENDAAIEAQTTLVEWDSRFSPDSIAATLFQVWYYGQLAPALISRIGGEVGEAVVTLPDERTILDVLRAPHDWLDGRDPLAERDALIERTLASANRDASLLSGFGFGDGKPWGELLTARLRHLAYAKLSSRTRKMFALQDMPRGGDLTTPGMALFDEDFSVLFGASWRMVIDVGEWDNSVFVNAPGQSGDPRSKHYDKLYSVWAQNQSVPLLYSAKAISKSTESTIILEPLR